ncbi:ammonium transporter [Ruminococcus sp. AM23-1]|uniref:Ammonium transporter n=1 Tax=Blautia massiliensis (ex Durand et al. 2017) TaxID=1737424 RepID=A0ABW9X323_9FIRM|nr:MULTISPECIES: ammonium transporter [Blautia]PWY60207.1 ammonia permease [Blautia sp. BCRC 81119]RHN92434.1 ammonium transporter [Ruminococcus sp. AM23-1]MZL72284.1 ammonium transporter [Blautia massiliensis (ex Durand et al. 2017)]MZL77011.1 ammonium transporter [Blautia massiliensis (ex Durand et al. 2017)]RYT38213.1 ammonium transporter [Blautia sp. aa_0143]
MNAGDTGFILICTAFVFFMTPGLAFFYGGLVRRKNVVNTIMACGAIMGLSVVMWTLFGYSLAFGGNHGGIIGDFRWFALNGVGWEPGPYADTIPHLVFVAFQMMFAMITPALITGAVVGRMRFKALFFFIAIWSLIVYYPMAHMVWGDGGFLAAIGSVDFAGGNVVHISSGVSALVLAIYLGQRRGYAKATYRTHNIPFVFLGAAMLWFGWFGFNAGSALKADGLAAHAFMTSSISSACALLTWMLIEVIREGKPTLVGASTGLVIGLVAITPGAGFVPVWASFIIGILVSPICYFTVILLKQKLKIDDALDAFGCHGIGGIWGGIATGLFGKTSINSVAKWDGLVFGDHRLFLAQVLSIVITIAVAIVGTLICIGIVRIFTPLRVDPKEEMVGLDASQHGENAYPSFNGFD